MNSKSFVITLYGIALFLILSRWYKAGGSGLPEPRLIVAPSYLYGVLALTSDFLEGLPVVLAAGLTFGLAIAVHPQPSEPSGAAQAHSKTSSFGPVTSTVGGTK